MPHDPARARDLFLAALDRPPDERDIFLAEACGTDAALRHRLDALLAAHGRPDPVLDRPAAEHVDLPSDLADGPPPAPPGYALGAEVGRGGMGEVYRAVDARLGREVAVKVLRPRFAADPGVAGRFVREARVTARLQHPGIPPVHEVGALPDGRPFLAMKLVAGRTLADLLKDRPDRGRLVAIFEGVCQAVGYAHSRGVVHRDLKPANVMVGEFGEVQVMDWGLARVIDGPPEDESQAYRAVTAGAAGERETVALVAADRPTPVGEVDDPTRAGAVMGTPGYMAPEQARGEPADRRADVYGLGAVLCAVLTGSPPFEGTTTADTLRANAAGDPAPALARLAACGADPELVAVCVGCLSPRPDDRPDDAGAVAAAVAGWRLRADERARRAEVERAAADARAAGERKRRRVVLAAAALVAAGAGVAGWQAVRATAAEGHARAEAENARDAEGLAGRREGEARTAEAKATAKAAEAKAFGDFLVNNFLAATRPADGQGGVGYDARVSDALAKAEADIPAVFKDQPEAEARAWHAVGVTWRNLGKYDRAADALGRAVALRERDLGPGHPDTVNAVQSLAVTLAQRGDRRAAGPLYQRALAGFEAAHGPDAPEALRTAANLGVLYLYGKEPDRAEPLLRRALAGRERALGPNHPDTLQSINDLAGLHYERGELEPAEALHGRALAGRERALGPDHPDTLQSVQNLATVLNRRGDPGAAEPLHRRALAGREKVLGPDHPDTLASVQELALVLDARGDPGAAEALHRRALAGQERALGPGHTDAVTTATALARLLSRRGDHRAAAEVLGRALARREKALGPDHPDTLATANNLAVLFWRDGRLDRSVPLFEENLRRRVAVYGPDHPEVLTTAANLGINYLAAGRPGEAVPLLERAHAARPRHPGLGVYAAPLADAYAAAGRPADAARVVGEQLIDARRTLEPGSPQLGGLLAEAGRRLLDLDPAAAEPVLRECLGICERSPPPAWVKANLQSLLGGALMLRGKAAEAEPLLVAGYAGLLADLRNLPPAARGYPPEAASRLARVYLLLGRPDEATKWRAERAKYPPDTAPPPRLRDPAR